MSLMDQIVLAEASAAALASSIFVAAYAFRSPWWRSEVGANTMALMFVVAFLVTLTVVFRVTGVRAGDWLGALLWGLLNVPLWWRVSILWRAQHGKYQVPMHKCTSCGQNCLG